MTEEIDAGTAWLVAAAEALTPLMGPGKVLAVHVTLLYVQGDEVGAGGIGTSITPEAGEELRRYMAQKDKEPAWSGKYETSMPKAS